MSPSVPSNPPLLWENSPLREVLRLSVPTVISLLSFSLMTLVDMLFIGRLGAAALAGTGLGGVCVFTVASFGLAILAAAKVKVGENYARGDSAAVCRALGAFIRLALLMGVLSVLAGQLIALALPYVSGDGLTGTLARDYAQVRSLGFVFILVSAALGQWLQAQGDTRSAMQAALASNALNVPLNAWLIFGLDGGVVGAAAATVLARGAEMFWLLGIQRRGRIRLQNGSFISPGLHLRDSNWKHTYEFFLVGLPTGLERVLDMAALAAVPLLLSSLGPAHVAAHQVVLQICFMAFLPMIALGESLSVLASQVAGVGRWFLLPRLTGLGIVLALSYATFCAALCILATEPLLRIFTPDQEVIAIGVGTLLFGAVLQILSAAYNQFKGVLRGLSIFGFVAMTTVGCAWLITPPLTYLLGVRGGMGAAGAWAALCLEVGLGVLLLGLRLRHQFRRLGV